MPRTLQKHLAALVMLGLLCFGSKLFCGHVLHWGSPYDSTVAGDLGDLKMYGPALQHLHEYAFLQQPPNHGVRWQYPAPAVFPYLLLYALPHKELVMYCLIWATFAVGAVLLSYKMLEQGMRLQDTLLFVGISAVAAYPFWYESKAGNIEILIFILIAAAVWAFCNEMPMVAAILIGIAGAMKMYPYVFTGLLLARRQYRSFFLTFLIGGAITIYSLSFITPSIAYSWSEISNGLNLYRVTTFEVVNRQVIGFDHSLFALIKRPFLMVVSNPNWIKPFLKAYLAAAALGGIALFFLRIRKLPVLNQVILLTTAATFLPPSSYDYTLLHLYVPWSMLVVFSVREAKHNTPGLSAILVCFAGLMAAEAEFIHHSVGFGGQIRALFFIATFVLALKYPLRVPAHKTVEPVAALSPYVTATVDRTV